MCMTSKFEVTIKHSSDFDEIEIRDKIEQLLNEAIDRTTGKDFEVSMMELDVKSVI